MNPLLRFLAAIALSLCGAAALAHGPEEHEDATTSGVEASTDEAAPMAEEVSTGSGQPVADHDSRAGSIWSRLHPATVHFPIALLLMAALTELIAIARPSPAFSSAVRVMVWGGAAGAIVAAGFGWLHTGFWLGGDATMQWHRWTGTSLAILAPIAAILAGRGDRTLFRLLLFFLAAVLLAQGYWGGELAHGPHHLGF